MASLTEKVTGRKPRITKPLAQQTFYTNWKPKLYLRSKEEVIADMKKKEEQKAGTSSSSTGTTPKARPKPKAPAPVLPSSNVYLVAAKKDDPNFT